MNRAVWFLDQGIGVFPIRHRSKEPACKSWDDYPCTREEAKRLVNYGVRLCHWLGVIDTDEPSAEEWVAGTCPATKFMVKTARGIHRYFRLPLEATPKFIHRDGLTIEFRNVGQYVVGPGSVNADGIVYEAADWSWNMNDVTMFPADFLFDDRPGARAPGTAPKGEAFEFPDTAQAGERHDALYKLLRSFKARGDTKENGRHCVSLANEYRCVPPLKEDAEFERWFNRGWDAADRPMAQPSPEDAGLDL